MAYLPQMSDGEWIAAVILGLAFLFFAIKSSVSHKKKDLRKALVVYCAEVFFLSIIVREPKPFSDIKLELFWTYRAIWKDGPTWMFWEMVYNFVMLMPVGFMASQLTTSGQRKKTIPLIVGLMSGMLLSIVIEMAQLLMRRGTFELDDIFHNTVGAGVGALVNDVMNKMNDRMEKRDLKSVIVDSWHAHDSGWIFSLRVLHGKVHEWWFGKIVNWRAKWTKKENLVVATAFTGKKYGDNPRYIIEKLHDRSPQTTIQWLCEESIKESLPPYIQAVDMKNRKEVVRALAKASIIIENNRCFYSLSQQSDQLHIDTWHGGLGFKKIGRDADEFSKGRIRNGCDLFLSNSDHLTKVFRSGFLYRGPVWKVGYPIEDALLTSDMDKRTFLERYHIAEGTQIVLYAPTHRSHDSWRSKIIPANIIKALEHRFGGKWVLVVHWHQIMNGKDKCLPGAIDVTDTANMQGLVKTADAFISDYSSSIFQAVQRHIPCFVYADDYEAYNVDRGLYYPLEEQPFPYALTEKALIDNILHYDAAVWEEKWQQYRKRMGHIVTGHSADDVAKVCVDFLNGKSKADIMKEIPFETRF